MKMFTLLVAIILATAITTFSAEKAKPADKENLFALFSSDEKVQFAMAYSIGYETYFFSMGIVQPEASCVESLNRSAEFLEIKLNPEPKNVTTIKEFQAASSKWDAQIRERLKKDPHPQNSLGFYLFGRVQGALVDSLLSDLISSGNGKIDPKFKTKLLTSFGALRNYIVNNDFPDPLLKSMDAMIASYKKAKTKKEAYAVGISLMKWNVQLLEELVHE
jgi:hypothetical protein